MPTYDYQCQSCNHIHEVRHSINHKDPVECPQKGCKGISNKVILTAPATVIPPHMQATGSKFEYYGVDPVTGDGITEDTDVRDPAGVNKVSSKKL